MDNIKINDKIIGKDQPCFIIAEAGVNHNGDINLAKKLIEAAKKAGADAVKFQKFKSEDLVTDEANMADYQKKNTGKKESQLDMLKRLELSSKEFKELKKYCDKKEIIFLSTPHTENALNFLDNLMPVFKIGSGDLTNLPFLENLAKKQKPIFLSTGMANVHEIREAVDSIKRQNNNKIILLHCTTSYPCPKKDSNLNAMKTLEKEFNCLTGYSDHTEGLDVSLMAASLGAVLIEKHFTLDKNMEGPDHKASLDPEELKELVKKIKNKDYPDLNKESENKILGKEKKEPTQKEIEIAKVARKSIVASQDIKKDKEFSFDNLIIKRPGTGIRPKEIYNIIGKKAKHNIKKNTLIKKQDIQN